MGSSQDEWTRMNRTLCGICIVCLSRYCATAKCGIAVREHQRFATIAYLAQIEYLVCIRVRPSSRVLTLMRSSIWRLVIGHTRVGVPRSPRPAAVSSEQTSRGADGASCARNFCAGLSDVRTKCCAGWAEQRVGGRGPVSLECNRGSVRR